MSSPSEDVVLFLPEPPGLNEMLAYAKRRRFVGKKAFPIVYDDKRRDYRMLCLAQVREDRISPPETPWARWKIVNATWRIAGKPRDLLELQAGLKWAIDFLVDWGYVAGDSPKELIEVPGCPPVSQLVDRKKRGVYLWIRRVL